MAKTFQRVLHLSITGRGREKQAPHQEPDAGLDPGTPGSRPGPKAGAKPLSHPGIPFTCLLKHFNIF